MADLEQHEKFEIRMAELADKVNYVEMMRLTTSKLVRQLAE